MNRRGFLAAAGAALVGARVSDPRLGATGPARLGVAIPQAGREGAGPARFRTGLVAYSYRKALEAKTMTYEDLVRIAVETGTDGVEMTVYWLPSTSDDYLLPLRRLAYRNRVEIYGIGTRVRLAQPTADLREQQLAELRKWLDVAQKLGATHVRVFGGDKPDGATLDQAIGFAAETMKRGAELAGARGLILVLEDDGGITDFAKDTIEIVKRADSPWASMNLDIGNLRPPAVYDQIDMAIPYAVTSHIKTELTLDDGKTHAPFDWDRVFKMFAAQHYRGYMGLEFEASGDPATEVPAHLRRLKELAVKYLGVIPVHGSRDPVRRGARCRRPLTTGRIRLSLQQRSVRFGLGRCNSCCGRHSPIRYNPAAGSWAHLESVGGLHEGVRDDVRSHFWPDCARTPPADRCGRTAAGDGARLRTHHPRGGCVVRVGVSRPSGDAAIVRADATGQMILIAGPYRSGTGDDPVRMAANVRLMEAYALPMFRAGHVPVLGEWFALPLVSLADARSGLAVITFAEAVHGRAGRRTSWIPRSSRGADTDGWRSRRAHPRHTACTYISGPACERAARGPCR